MALCTRTAQKKNARTRITVVVRVRPQNQREVAAIQGNLIEVVDDRVLIFDPPGERVQKPTFLPTSQPRAKNLHFGFDKVLGPSSTQEDVFNVIKNSIFSETGGLLDGINCTVFAYGATGSGKTFSMAGTPDNPGLMARAVENIFTSIEQQAGRRPKLRMSYLEIYNEQIRDLLKSPEEQSKEMKIVEDPKKGIYVTNLSYCYPESTSEVLEFIQIGNNRRTQAQTESNPVSSRSHAVCQIEVENCEEIPGISSSHPIGKLSLIDLAGSERATSNTGIRLRESGKINCSLLALSNCINALCTQSSFIPFRQSKLTRLLKDSLGGNCKTVCLSCISSSYLTYDDTFSTLQYANKTKNIRTNVSRNTLNVKARISQYPKMIADLKEQIQVLQLQSGSLSDAEIYQKSLEKPFLTQRCSIQTLVDQEIQSIPENDIKEQLLALKRFSNTNFFKDINNKINEFNIESSKKKPANSTSFVNIVQEMKKYELENFALKGQLQYALKQIEIQQNIIHSLTQDQTNVIQANNELLNEEKNQPNETNSEKSFDKSEITVSIPKAFPPFLPISPNESTISETETVDTTSPKEATKILKQKFQEAQRFQMQNRKPLGEKYGNGNIETNPNTISKPPIRSLMDQLSQRVASVNLNVTNNEEPAGILLRSRLLAHIGPR